MHNNAHHLPPIGPAVAAAASGSVTAIVPARNEEAVIAACIASLASQPEIGEILVVNDQSTDGTASVVTNLMGKISNLRLLEAGGLPDGWLGKNHAVSVGVQQAKCAWLLFTDADAEHQRDSVSGALRIAQEHTAALVSFSPEQITGTWYEKSLIPYVYLRLAKRFSYEQVNDPNSPVAAANGQFLMMRRDVYDAIGGHTGVAGEVLEDVALARRVKAAGQRIWFGSGNGIVRVRMYRSFRGMWQGWKKNVYHNPNLSPEENRRIFGKCNNPHGHGHNYTLEVTVEGQPDPVTGMVLDLKELKEILEREIMQRMDHRHLNYEVAELAGQIPTCENIDRIIWQCLDSKITKGRLHPVRLYESPDLFADCYRNGASAAGKA